MEDDPNEKPDPDDCAAAAGAALGVGVDDDPNENVGAALPLGDPLLGTAAPNENAVDGEVEGGLALKENPLNAFCGVETLSAGVAGAWAALVLADEEVEVEPKLNPVADFGASSFLLSLVDAPKLNELDGLLSDGAAGVVDAPNENGEDFFGSSELGPEVVLAGAAAGALPNVNGDELAPPAGSVGTKPVPGVDDEAAVGGLSDPKNPDEGAEGGLGIASPAADPFVEVLPGAFGLQPVEDAISAMNFDACSPSGPRTFDRSRNGSSFIASERVLTKDSFIPRIDVQYSTSAAEGSEPDDDEAFGAALSADDNGVEVLVASGTDG